jgi:hypothetical protein
MMDVAGTIGALNSSVMKRALLLVVLSLAISSQAHAILRPRFPVKTRPPFNGDIIIIGDDTRRNQQSTIANQK